MNLVETIFWGPSQTVNVSAPDAGLESTLKKYRIPFSNMLSFTSDTCNVMKGARKGVIAHLRKEQPKVLDAVLVMLSAFALRLLQKCFQ